MSDNSLNNKGWNERKWTSAWWTNNLMSYLKHSGQISNYAEVTLKVDKEDAVDYVIEEKPSQFKIRINPEQHDIPVNMIQPSHGFDRPMNNVSPGAAQAARENFLGRDIKGLLKGISEEYYVAIKSPDGLFCEVYRVSTKKLLEIIKKLEEEWEAVKQFDGEWRNPFWRTRKEALTQASIVNDVKGLLFKSSDGHEIWMHKNGKENYCKINYYLQEHIKEESFVIPPGVARRMEEVFQVALQKIRRDNESSN